MSSDAPMRDVAVKVVGLSKKYHIGAEQARHTTLVDQLSHIAGTPFRRAKKLLRGQATGAAELDETIWALRDISFEVERGEVLGIIGKNGAGKSTLLKILSRITEPTEGYAEIRGRVGSLLEVGTGFHPELTGRENIYLNGAILGMRRTEIDRKFKEIVAFAETEKFLDTPIKHYSSGMRVRLAFAVAAHLEPDVLVVDEVLSVGDAAFQRKCLGKMGKVAKSGRTVLFVSHNMGAVTQLCERVLLLENGQLTLSGHPTDVVSTYLSTGVATSGSWVRPEAEEKNEKVLLQAVRLMGDSSGRGPVVAFDQPFRVEIDYEVRSPLQDVAVLCRVENQHANVVWTSWDTDTTEWKRRIREPGGYRSTCVVPARMLRPGRYFLTVGAVERGRRAIELFEQALAFDVSAVGFRLNTSRIGVITPMLEWEVSRCDAATRAIQESSTPAR